MKPTLAALVAGALAAIATGTAGAAPITGALDLSSVFATVQVRDAGNRATTDLRQGVRLDFTPNYPVPNAVAVDGTGVLGAAFPLIAAASVRDVTYAPFAGPVDNFFYVSNLASTLYFDLLGLTSTVTAGPNGGQSLTLFATGTLQLTGYDDTPGTWTFSTQHSGSGAANSRLTWSADVVAADVPEPGALALVGLGLAAWGVARKRKA